ncbi:phosphatase PAP2 family protein [Kitasatospora sp. A2-31]|uniref:phosphatase PAP2 family protein n=1 Tax=Kitasatospora sp. A2-31 TaxID=2916414 RepID=UPI001EEE92DE|nr:phosphatase PAP2 family protein [Kitasatospora sp. A2-31]MCG6498990.1 phosphatase PAP2 family protein [Kitasatospora sp. A2-31]
MHLTSSSGSITPRSRHLLRQTALAVCCAALFAVLAALVESGWGPLARFDQGWVDHLHSYARDRTAWTASVQTLSDIGGTITVRTVLGIAAVWLWVIGARVLAVWAVAQTLIGWGALWVLKLSFDRRRPLFPDPVSHAGGPAYPSGHAMASAITCAALVGLFWSQLRRNGRIAACAVAASAVLSIGWTRIALGVHWPSDVLGGWLAAGVVLGGVTVAVELWRPGALARDIRRVNRRTRPRVRRIVVSSARPAPYEPDFEEAPDPPDGAVGRGPA